jgi:glutamate 5-kinase
LKLSEKKYKRIVVKIGSSLLYGGRNKLDSGFLADLAREISSLMKDDKEVILVSSGAIACGMSVLKLESRPRELSYLQAAAALGQHELMHAYKNAFKEKSLVCAQVLLTWEDFNGRKRYLNAKNTLLTLLKLGTVPVINENDTVSTDEIKFGDNDRLSALVASLISAELLVILSDIDGLLMKDKKTVIRVVGEITPEVKALACPAAGRTCVGGMSTKIEAARIAVDSGIPCVIANGKRKGILSSVVKDPESSGTLFIPKAGYLTARERWIAFSAKPKGKITVDEGAKNALLNGKSLLSVGVAGLEGFFESGDVVAITDKKDCEFARGKTSLSSRQLEKVKGSRHDKEAVHCDNLVIL